MVHEFAYIGAGKRKRDEDHDARQKIDQGISKYFSRGAQATKPKPKVRSLSWSRPDRITDDPV